MKRIIFGKKKNSKRKVLFFLSMVLLGVMISYKRLEKTKIKITNKEFIKLITSSTFQAEDTFIDTIVDKALEVSNPIRLLNNDYKKYLYQTAVVPIIEEEKQQPVIYLYNTHQTEEYAFSSYAEFSVYPTVIMNNYILEDIFNKNGYLTIVEESSIKDILNQNNWNYAASYKASRILMEESKKNYPSLKYFIDIHRDSLTKDKTTITINNKEYAKILFIVGMENTNYQGNLELTEKIHNKINEYYPNLSKGIYKKSGYGVNGIYNQDFSPNTILVEMGGYQNNTTEILNTALAFSRCFMEVIHEENR